MNDIRQKLLAVFQAEHKDHLAGIRAALAKLEEGVATGKELDEAFRRAHSLKGAARAVDLHELETLAHRLETLFSKVRGGTMQLEKPVVGLIHTVLDITEDIMSALSGARGAVDIKPTLASLDLLLAVETVGPVASAAAAVQEPAAGPARAAFEPVDTLRVNADHIDRILRTSGRLMAENQRQELVTGELGAVAAQVEEIEREWEHVRRHAGAALRQLGESPGFSRVARYLSFVEHRCRSLAGQTRTVRTLQGKSAWSTRNLGEELQRDVKRARMVPAGSVFEGFGKMIRDLARDEKKDVAFQVSGFEVEADRVVFQALKDPLMHMLRNAVHHGLETPEERRKMGKDPGGRVMLRIETQGNRLRITVEDDGRGINWQQVAETAVRKGMLDSAAAVGSKPDELVRFLFQPGFSTAKCVTEISGRGMGLSIVAETLARFQGEFEVLGRPGPGSAIMLSVPLSISTRKMLVVSCQGQRFAIPLHGIERVDRVKIGDVERVERCAMVRIKDKVLPFLNLAQLLGFGEAVIRVEGEFIPVVIVRWSGKRVAVAVDALVTQQEGLILNVPAELASLRAYAGCTIAGNGEIILVLNPAELAEAAEKLEAMPLTAPPKADEAVRQRSILVVDDSITTRTLEKSILEAHGYHVDVAVDGEEALNFLRSQAVDLIISDVQMPRLDGFGLLEGVRRDKRLTKLPFILVTSLESPADQERGLALGADAYIVKRKFDQRNLLETIRQIL